MHIHKDGFRTCCFRYTFNSFLFSTSLLSSDFIETKIKNFNIHSILSTSSADSTTKLWWLNQTVSPNGAATSSQEGTMPPPTLLRQLRGHSKWVWDSAFTVDAKYIVTCSSDQTARLWDVSSGEVVKTYVGHQKAITAVALNDLA